MGSRTLDFRDMNSKVREHQHKGCALPLSYSHYHSSKQQVCLADTGTPAVKVQRGFGCIMGEITSHVHLVI